MLILFWFTKLDKWYLRQRWRSGKVPRTAVLEAFIGGRWQRFILCRSIITISNKYEHIKLLTYFILFYFFYKTL